MLTGLAVAFAFRAKFWNIGAEGQLLAGALAATVLGVHIGSFPAVLVLPTVIVGGFLAGGLWASIPALLKTKLKVDDVVSTLLLNYVMIHLMGALLFGPLQQPGSSWPRSSAIIEAACYPILVARSRFHLGILISFAAVVIIWFINKKTTFGYRSKAVGEPPFMHGNSVFFALSDAVAACGTAYPALDAPATPERVLAAIRRVRQG